MKKEALEEKSTKSRPQFAEALPRNAAPDGSAISSAAEFSNNHAPVQFVLCLDSTGYEVSLEKGKLYPVIPDNDAASFDEVRVVDESGEDYLFPARRFARIDLPEEIKAILMRT